MYVHVYIYICVCVCIHACIYIYIYIYTHIYIYIYICLHVHACTLILADAVYMMTTAVRCLRGRCTQTGACVRVIGKLPQLERFLKVERGDGRGFRNRNTHERAPPTPHHPPFELGSLRGHFRSEALPGFASVLLLTPVGGGVDLVPSSPRRFKPASKTTLSVVGGYTVPHHIYFCCACETAVHKQT
jgi:hypothetical protein